MLELIIGQIPEAIFFSLFMIYAKGLKEKRVLFTILMIAEYLLLKKFIHFNIWFQILYTFMTFVILKLLYKEKSQIIDIFTFTVASIILIISSILCFLISFGNVVFATIINRIILLIFIFAFKDKLKSIQNLYKRIWNRETNKTKIKTTTFRSLNVIIFNILFWLLNILLMFAIYYNSIMK